MLPILIGAGFMASAGWVGTLLSRSVAAKRQRNTDGPPPHTPPVALLLGACAVIGGVLVTQNVTPMQLVLSAVVCLALVACWCSDAQLGLVPDVFTLPPLALAVLFAIWKGEWWLIVSACVAAAPFAVAAAITKGHGMGWGDVKLAALGGAVLGAQLSIPVFAAACAGAVIVSRIRRCEKSEPIAFAPYLAAAIGIAIPLGVHV